MSEERSIQSEMGESELVVEHEQQPVYPRPKLYTKPILVQENSDQALDQVHPNSSLIYKVMKRTLDLIVSGIGLIVLSPVFLIIAVAIKVEDPKGRVLYVASRGGLHNAPFPCYKFRSMYTNADEIKDTLKSQNEMSGPVFKIRDDPRITKVGRVLRRGSLDELPQLINVWRGNMSLVGPRPLPVVEANAVNDIGRIRELVKPGITCIWQVSGRNNIDFDDWMKLDVEYVRTQSFLLDLKLLVKTIPAVLSGDGAR